MASFDDIDTSRAILSHLGARDVCALASVCRFWNASASDSMVWRRLFMTRWPGAEPEVIGTWREMYWAQSSAAKACIANVSREMKAVVEKEPVGVDLLACEEHLQSFADQGLSLHDIREHIFEDERSGNLMKLLGIWRLRMHLKYGPTELAAELGACTVCSLPHKPSPTACTAGPWKCNRGTGCWGDEVVTLRRWELGRLIGAGWRGHDDMYTDTYRLRDVMHASLGEDLWGVVRRGCVAEVRRITLWENQPKSSLWANWAAF